MGRQILRWSWLLTLPLAAAFLFWASETLERYWTFGVRYDARPFKITLRQAGAEEARYLLRTAELALDPRTRSRRSGQTELRTIHLFVPEAELQRLNANLPHSGFEYVRGRIADDGKLRKVKFRYRGDFPSHWWGTKKSLRVKTKKGNLFLGMRSFNLIAPKFASQINTHLGYRLADELGLVAPYSEVVDVTVNGEWSGLHVLVEQLEELTLRRHARMPGDVYAGELVSKDRYDGVLNNVFDHPRLWEKVAANNHYPLESRRPLERLLALVRAAPSESVHRELGRLVDMEEWGRFSAFETLTQSFHYDQAHNWRLYFDPARSRFVPVVWDPSPWHPNWMPKRGEPARLDIVPSDLHRLLFANADFLRARARAFRAFFQSGLDTALRAEVSDVAAKSRPSIGLDPHGQPIPGMGPSGVGEKLDALDGFERAVEVVLGEVEAAFVGTAGEVRYAHEPGSGTVALSVTGRRPVERVVLRYLDPIGREAPGVRVRYWRDGLARDVDVSGGVSVGPTRIEIAADLIARHRLVDVGGQGLKRHRIALEPAYYEIHIGGERDGERAVERGDNPLLEVRVDRGGPELEPARLVSSLAREPIEGLYAVVPERPAERVLVWSGDVEVDDVRRIDRDLLLRPGTTVRLAPGAGLILGGRLIAEGTSKRPIRFVPASGGGDPWGAVVLLGRGANGSRLSHCEFAGGSGLKGDLFEYSAMFSVHDVHGVDVSHCVFRDNQAVDDMVHTVYAEIRFEDSVFSRAPADAVDLDISRGSFERCRFDGNGNDAIDLMTASAVVVDSTIEGSGDKGVSVGEGSRLLAINVLLDGNWIGVQSKDGSVAVLYNVDIRGGNQPLDAYQKNWRYDDGGSIYVYKSRLAPGAVAMKADRRSHIQVYDSYLAPEVVAGERVSLEANVDRDSVSEARERSFRRVPEERDAFGDPFPGYWKRVDPSRRGVSPGREALG